MFKTIRKGLLLAVLSLAILIAIYLIFLSPLFGKNFYERRAFPVGTEVTVTVSGDEELSIFIEKVYLSKSNSTFYLFGRIQFNAELESFQFLNVNCISMFVELNETEIESLADVYDHGVIYVGGTDLEYNRSEFESWELIYWTFPQSGLSEDEFSVAVKASARLSAANRNAQTCHILSNQRRSINPLVR